MAQTVIKVENISKQYRLGNVGLGTLSHDLNRWWYNVRGKEDPYLKIGEENNRANYRFHKNKERITSLSGEEAFLPFGIKLYIP